MTQTYAPALSIEYWPIERLVPHARNARTHSPAQVAEIAGSIRSFGFVNPVLVGAEGDIIAGHGRLAAARTLNLEVVPVIVLSGLSELQRRQLVLADNRIALNAGWDLDMLKLELTDLKGMGADLSALGFEKKELARLLVPVDVGLTDENEVPSVATIAVSRPGDLWCLGSHRLACGSSTDPEMVGTLLGDVVPNLMVTDPPYGVSYDPTWRHRVGVNSSARVGKVQNDDIADWSEVWALFPGQIAYVWHGALHATTVADSLISTGFAIRSQIIWAKERLVIGRGDYHWRHEPCWYAVRRKGNWTGDRKQTTLWEIGSGNQDAETVHGTQKPVECMRRPILNNSIPGDAVYEPFLGSGTTLIAAESTGRICLAMELDPLYVDVAIRRWQAFTGKAAILYGSDRTFAQVAEERAAGPPNGGETPPPGTAAPTQTANSLGAPEAGPHLPRGTRFPLADDQAATSSGMADARDRPVPTTQAPVAPDHGGA
ncbi:MAG: site-specific DNA-methyltransferase [Rhizobiales bacterium]|nr:site-specific DNA-methyltransferase [Hyphomicrobiales bacterium]